ncbi:MAG: TetR/AcrR family transcriptional regulator [Mycobacterium sp.]
MPYGWKGGDPVSRDDWLFEEGRSTAASERIYAAAAELIARHGIDAFNIDELAARVHCSRATIYRHVGGKSAIRDAVMARSAERIVDIVRARVDGLTGAERVLTAVEVALAEIRSDPAGQLFIESAQGFRGSSWLGVSPTVTQFATELTGLADNDPQGAKWVVRLVLSLLFWPEPDAATEHRMLQRYVAPAFDGIS